MSAADLYPEVVEATAATIAAEVRAWLDSHPLRPGQRVAWYPTRYSTPEIGRYVGPDPDPDPAGGTPEAVVQLDRDVLDNWVIVPLHELAASIVSAHQTALLVAVAVVLTTVAAAALGQLVLGMLAGLQG